MTPRPHHHGCGHCNRCCSGVDEDLWALGELLVAPILAAAVFTRWAIRRPLPALGVLVALAVAVVIAWEALR